MHFLYSLLETRAGCGVEERRGKFLLFLSIAGIYQTLIRVIRKGKLEGKITSQLHLEGLSFHSPFCADKSFDGSEPHSLLL